MLRDHNKRARGTQSPAEEPNRENKIPTLYHRLKCPNRALRNPARPCCDDARNQAGKTLRHGTSLTGPQAPRKKRGGEKKKIVMGKDGGFALALSCFSRQKHPHNTSGS